MSHEPLIAEARSRLSGEISEYKPIMPLLSNRIDAIFPSWNDTSWQGSWLRQKSSTQIRISSSIDTLRRSKLFRRYEQVFSEATGLPLTLRPVEYWQLAHHGKKHENPFCALLAERPATLSVCLQAHEQMIHHTG